MYHFGKPDLAVSYDTLILSTQQLNSSKQHWYWMVIRQNGFGSKKSAFYVKMGQQKDSLIISGCHQLQ